MTCSSTTIFIIIFLMYESEKWKKIKLLVLKCEKLSSFLQSKLAVCDVLIDAFMKDQNHSQSSCL